MFNNNKVKSVSIELLNSYNQPTIQEKLDRYLKSQCSDKYLNAKKLMVSDCDGIISTNESFYTKNGKELKSYGCYDKEMMRLLKTLGWEFIFISDDLNGFAITKKRIEDLGEKIENIKYLDRERYVKELKTNYDVVVYLGDSISDIPAMIEATYSGTVANAPQIVKEFSNYYSDLNGGFGGFADVIWNIHDELKDKNI